MAPRGSGPPSLLHRAVLMARFFLAAFRALLQIRAMRKKLGPLSPTSFNPIISSQTSDSEEHSVRRAFSTWGPPVGASAARLSLGTRELAAVASC